MKKLAVLAVAAMLVFSLAGQAAAFFEDLKLIRTIYDAQVPTEIGSDLGLKALTSYGAYWPPSPEDYVGDVIAKSAFTSALADLRVAYYAKSSGATDLWATGFGTGYPATNPPGPWTNDGDGMQMGSNKWSTLSGLIGSVQGYYATGSSATFTGSTTNANSYYTKLDKNGTAIGGLGDTLRNATFWEVEISLGDLLTQGYVDQILYFWDNPTTATFAIEVATIRTFLTKDGETIDLTGDKIATVINPSAVPIPGSVLLLASGLLGLFGFRKKRA